MILASNMSYLVQVWSRTPALILALAMVPVPLAAQTSAFTGDDATWSLYGIVASPAGPGGIGHPDYIVSDLGANWDEDRGIGGVGFEFEARDQPGCFGEVGYGWEFQDAHLGLALRQEDSALIEIDAAAQGSAGCTEPLPLSMSVMTGVSNVNCRNSDIWAEIQARYPNEQTEVLYRHPNADPQSLFINTSFFRNRVEEGSSPRLILDDRNTFDRTYHVNHRFGLINFRMSVLGDYMDVCYYYVGDAGIGAQFEGQTGSAEFNNSCIFANDGDCDEPNGLGYCEWGTDTTDCSNPNSNFGDGAGYIQQ